MSELLLDIAKRTLGIAPNNASSRSVPTGYLDELRKHVAYSQGDTHFRLYPQPGYGYGVIRCLEKGCEHVSLGLGKRMGVDDGLKEGIGSLSVYRIHVQDHPAQLRKGFARVNAKPEVPSNPAKTVMSTVRPVLSLSMGVKSESSEPSSPPSASSPLIPLKRHVMGSDTNTTLPNSSSPAARKKIKLEDPEFRAPLVPLGPRDGNRGIANQNTYPLTPNVARLLLSSADASILRIRMSLSSLHGLTRTTDLVRQQIATLEQQLLTDLHNKARCEALLRPTGNIAVILNKQEDNAGFPPTASAPNSRFPPPSRHAPLSLSRGTPNYGDTAGHDSEHDDGFGHNYLINRGPVPQPDDIDRFLQEAGNSELFDGNASIEKALEKLGLQKMGEHLPFMSIALMPHQIIGVAWMLEHERGSHKGGILADEMGLGKTVQMIATIVGHRSNDPAVKSTLVCAPLALLEQWKLEIETKTDGSLSCLIYHGSGKTKTLRELQKYDVVITTFQTMTFECPQFKPDGKKNKKKKSKDSEDDFIESNSQTEKKAKKGLLFKMKWFRVVLDEAQNVRNRNTRASNAVTDLDTQYRWCLTGTPITNSLADCYGLIRFLRIRPWYDWKDFNGHIACLERRQPDIASRRLQAILNSCLLRRKKDSVLDGKKLIELPPKDVILRKLTFSQEERDIYDLVEKRSQEIFNKYRKAGTVLKNYTHVLVLLLRLRQLCSHPCLIQEDGDAFIRSEGELKHEVQTELDKAIILAGQKFVDDTKAKLKDIALRRMTAEKASADASVEEEECPICFDVITNVILTRCGHSFCADCIDAVMQKPTVEDGNEPRYAMSERPCPVCRTPVQKEMIFQRTAFEPTDAELDEYTNSPIVIDAELDEDDGMPIDAGVLSTKILRVSAPAGNGKRKRKQRFSKKLAQSDDVDDDMSDFMVESDEDKEEAHACCNLKRQFARNKRIVLDSDEDGNSNEEVKLLPPKVVRNKKGGKNAERFLPSTKMKEMMVLLKDWAEAKETKNEKTMVLSQWTSCLDLIADYLDENGFTFVRYQGDMSRRARDTAVKLFMSQGKARIMLMSLKCGGVGLNLTRANRVISIDLGWSSAVESQAFDRVHRLGQTLPVTVQRLVIEDTVEARILSLQERKQNLADGSLGEGTGKKLGKLTVQDLANLFGLTAHGRHLNRNLESESVV